MKLAVVVLSVLFLFACSKAPEIVNAPEQIMKEESVAVLAVQSGMAVVNDQPATPGLELREGDLVATKGGAKVSIVFFDSTVLRLDENTEIEVKRIVKGDNKSVSVKQFTGSTWSRILKVSGIKEYSVETPSTVATVRGTGFSVTVSDGDSEIKVKEGSVHVASLEDGQVVAEAVVNENFEVEISDETPADIELEALEPDEWVDENVQYDDEFIDEVVEKYVEEHPEIVEGMSEEEAEVYVGEIVTGGEYVEESVEEIVEPVQEPVEEVVPDEIVVEEAVEEPAVEETIDPKIVEENREPIDVATYDSSIYDPQINTASDIPLQDIQPVYDAQIYDSVIR